VSTEEQAEELYIAVAIRNRMAAKADIRLQYELAPEMVLTCEANDVAAADHRYGLCKVPLRGRATRKDGGGWVLLTPEEKTSVRDSLLAMHLAVDTGCPRR
jgi:hypothetical protein